MEGGEQGYYYSKFTLLPALFVVVLESVVCWWWAGLLRLSKTIFHFIIVQHVTCMHIAIIQLFESEQYEEAALHAATSPKVRVRVENGA